MKDIIDVIKNISEIYDSDVAFTVLKDFERVLDDLDVYVYDNWQDGELVAGPKISRHWVTCSFMWEHVKLHSKKIKLLNHVKSAYQTTLGQ